MLALEEESMILEVDDNAMGNKDLIVRSVLTNIFSLKIYVFLKVLQLFI